MIKVAQMKILFVCLVVASVSFLSGCATTPEYRRNLLGAMRDGLQTYSNQQSATRAANIAAEERRQQNAPMGVYDNNGNKVGEVRSGSSVHYTYE